MENDILHAIAHVKDRIKKACEAAGRPPESVKLLLATKTVPAERIKIALQTGEKLIAENKVQEVKEKFDALQEVPHTNHFIGHLQTNKIKDLLKYRISCIQSLDRWELAEKLNARLALEGQHIEVLIQVNTSFEESKFGITPAETIELVKKIATLQHLKIKGLMTIGLFSEHAEEVRKCFKLLKDLQQEIIGLNISGVDMDELSMGMSNDLEVAIAEGATIIRVGTAIFGKRNTPDSFYWKENKSDENPFYTT